MCHSTLGWRVIKKKKKHLKFGARNASEETLRQNKNRMIAGYRSRVEMVLWVLGKDLGGIDGVGEAEGEGAECHAELHHALLREQQNLSRVAWCGLARKSCDARDPVLRFGDFLDFERICGKLTECAT